MDVNDLHPPDDYSHRFFIWHEWIPENVFEYFSTSMFYDKQSNNQVLRMQTMHTGTPIVNEAEELKRFKGIEFAVVHADPPAFFVIHKRERISREITKPVAAYFIMNNRIYQSPDLYSLLSNRLLASISSLRTSLNGFVWPIIDPNLADEGQQDKDMSKSLAKGKKIEGPQQRQKNSRLLLNAMYSTAARTRLPQQLPGTAQAMGLGVEIPDVVMGSAISPTSPAPMTTGTLPAPVKGQPGAGKKKRRSTTPAASTPVP
ncbi:MED6-domain-containing protein [Flagelloscypha sp. PMI_526]|nr:MED6-domain-containing protein [Flagelloscypha sp. PMI_526]